MQQPLSLSTGRGFQSSSNSAEGPRGYLDARIRKSKFWKNNVMPAHRKPTSMLQLVGAFKHDPKRSRVDPRSSPLKMAPPRPNPITFAQAWKLLAKCCPEGVLMDRDRIWLEIAAQLFVEFRNEGAKMHPAKLSRLTAMLSSLGMSPADASRVNAPPVRPTDDWN
jgi:hypothetical protein